MAKLNIVMDMSQYDMFLSCAYKYRNRYKLNLEGSSKNDALERGTLVHLACEIYYQNIKDGIKYQDAVDAALLKMKAAFVMESDLDSSEAGQLTDTMEQYFDYWRVADQQFEILGIEEPFMYLLHEDDDMRIYLAGKIDLRVRDNKYENLPYDHKSFSRSGPVNELSNQFKNYAIASGSNYLIVNKIGLQKTLKPHEKFLRVPVTYDHLIFEAWKKNVIKNIMNYIQCEAEDFWPTNETSCNKFNRMCEYFNVCKSSGEEAKKFKLMTEFVKVPAWDVTKVLKKTSEQIEDKREKQDG